MVDILWMQENKKQKQQSHTTASQAIYDGDAEWQKRIQEENDKFKFLFSFFFYDYYYYFVDEMDVLLLLLYGREK